MVSADSPRAAPRHSGSRTVRTTIDPTPSPIALTPLDIKGVQAVGLEAQRAEITEPVAFGDLKLYDGTVVIHFVTADLSGHDSWRAYPHAGALSLSDLRCK